MRQRLKWACMHIHVRTALGLRETASCNSYSLVVPHYVLFITLPWVDWRVEKTPILVHEHRTKNLKTLGELDGFNQ